MPLNYVDRFRMAMVERLMATGSLRRQAWIAAFQETPRHLFLRRFFRQSADLSGWEAISDADPGALEMIYSDTTWVTQLDNDPRRWETAHAGGTPVTGVPTSSSSAPGLMALMLEALALTGRHRVLEIGTGTGYNAALLCHRVGSPPVTTVELDPVLAGQARAVVHACGFTPTVAVADGINGYDAGAPYHRLIATCSVPAVPRAWIAQMCTGGLILTSLHSDLGGGALVLLRAGSGGRAQGRFLPDYGSFMPVRGQPSVDAAARLGAALATDTSQGETRAVVIPPKAMDGRDFAMITALRMTDVASIGFVPATGPQRWLLAADGSWACLDETAGTVTQHGARPLWDEVERLYMQWRQLGGPSRHRIGLTVTATGEHRFWVDAPQAVWWSHL